MIEFKLNGKDCVYSGDPLRKLLDVLRLDYGLLGAKEGCGEGECGACSVIKDGALVTSCIIPMGAVIGANILTIEGLRDSDAGKVLSNAFATEGAVQCGFCIPGMVMAAHTLLMNNNNPTDSDVRSAISGNMCRCTGYDLIVKAVLVAAEKGKGLW